MKEFFEKQWKRVVSVVLALVLVLGCVGMMPENAEVKAAGVYETVKFGATSYNANHVSNYWDINFNLSSPIAVPSGWSWNNDAWTVTVTIGGTTKNATLNYNGQYLLSFFIMDVAAPSDETTMIIQKGSYDSAGDEYGITISNDYKCVWDATNARWNVTMLPNYQELIFDKALVANYNTSAGWWEMTFGLTTPFQDPTSEWGPVFVNVPITIDSTEICNAQITMTNNTYQVTLFFSTSLDAPIGGEKLTIKEGQYQTNDGLHGITLTEDYVYQFSADTSTWVPYVEQTIADMKVDSVLNCTADNHWAINLIMEGTWPTSGPELDSYIAKDFTFTMTNKDGGGLPNATSFYRNGEYMLLDIWGEHTANYQPVEGDTITLSSGKLAYSKDENILINFSEETVLTYSGSEWKIQVDTQYQDINIRGIYVPSDAYNAEYWNLYADLSTEITDPTGSSDWGPQFTVPVLLDGNERSAKITMTGHAAQVNLFIETSLGEPQKGVILTIQKGEYADSMDSYGINITKDFSFWWNGEQWIESLQKSQYQDVNISDVYVPNEAYSASAWNIYMNLSSKIVDPDGEIWGPTFENVVVTIGETDYLAIVNMNNNEQQLSFYVSTDIGAPVNGTVMTVRQGLYADTTKVYGINVTKDFTFRYNGAVWALALGDSGVDADVNSDTFVNSSDLVRLISHRDNNTVAINEERADINYDGSKDEVDVNALRKVLLGMIYYKKDASSPNTPFGTPQYYNTDTIERMAFSCPAVGTWNDEKTEFTPYPQEQIDSELQRYKAAGFTLLNSEIIATLDFGYETTNEKFEPLRVLLEAADRNGLGVIVYSAYVNHFLREVLAENWQAILDDQIRILGAYPAFKGLMLADELEIDTVERYKSVVTYLQEKYPKLILHTTQLPIYAYEEHPTWLMPGADKNTSAETAYKYYAEAFGTVAGHYNYNLYALRNKYYLIQGRIDMVENEWYDSLKYVSEVAGAKGFTTGITIQATSIPGDDTYYHYAPTEEKDIGFQMYTAMAYGMQEISFYKWGKHESISDEENTIGTNADVYNAVKLANTDLNAFASVFKAFTWEKTLDISSGSTNSATGNTRLSSVTSSAARTFVGCMKDVDGFDGYMIANADGPRTAAKTSVTLTFNNATHVLVYKNGKKETVGLTGNAYTVEVAAGEGAFVIPLRIEE